MGLRGPQPLLIEVKILRGTLDRSRERKRQEREAERQEQIECVRTVCRFFLDEATESDRAGLGMARTTK